MRLLHLIRNSPAALLGVVLVGFGAWAAYDLMSGRSVPPQGPPVPAPPGTPETRAIPLPGSSELSIEPQTGPQVVTSEMMLQLQPGMPRADVEAVIGPPPANLVSPVAKVEGKYVYQTTYPANLDVPPSVPGHGGRVIPMPNQFKSLIALEFDASTPGHPLVKVYATQPSAKQS